MLHKSIELNALTSHKNIEHNNRQGRRTSKLTSFKWINTPQACGTSQSVVLVYMWPYCNNWLDTWCHGSGPFKTDDSCKGWCICGLKVSRGWEPGRFCPVGSPGNQTKLASCFLQWVSLHVVTLQELKEEPLDEFHTSRTRTIRPVKNGSKYSN